MENSEQDNGFTTTSHTLSCTLYPFVKLDGFAEDGIQWDDIETSTYKFGADGLAVRNSKPVLYTCTMTFLPNSSCRKILDAMAFAATPQFGKTVAKNVIVYTERNELTNTMTIYSGGNITGMSGGNSANLNDGQANKSYKFTFTSKVVLPM